MIIFARGVIKVGGFESVRVTATLVFLSLLIIALLIGEGEVDTRQCISVHHLKKVYLKM